MESDARVQWKGDRPASPHTPHTPASKKERLSQMLTPGGHKEREFPLNRSTKIHLKGFGRNAAARKGHQGPGESGVPLAAVARVAQNAKNNLRLWYLRHHAGESPRKSEHEIMREREKSEMLFYQLLLVTPVVLLAASSLQSEEGHEKKVPVVLQQISFKVTVGHAKHYHHMLKIQMEYGSGFTPMRWEIIRGHRDLQILRSKLRAGSFRPGIRGKKLKLPKVPKPEDFDHNHATEQSGADSQAPATGARSSYSASPGSASQDFEYELSAAEDELTLDDDDDDDDDDDADSEHTRLRSRSSSSSSGSVYVKPATFAEAVEEWLNRIKRVYMFRSDSNDLMQFLELSHLGLKLSAEYAFHGKEGQLIIRSRASELGWRVGHLHPHDFKDMITRHTKKWVLVRDSYIVIVDNIYSTRIREVFLVDPHFEVKHVKSELASAIQRHSDEKRGLGISDPAGVSGARRIHTSQTLKSVQTGRSLVSMAFAEPNIPSTSHKSMSAKTVFLHLVNNSRELKLAAMSERDLRRWQASMLQMQRRTPWSKTNRFDSYAPVRNNVFGQWFVDGRDYWWVLSEALENARDTIYILDWWLSPELYLRRPPEGNQRWRLDRVLKRKAEQGVKIFVVVYRNVGPTIPIDSLWTKHSLLDLHPNVHVMRSPNQLKNKSSLFWAHHEKMCVIDNTVAFNGGIDLCYGRWDTWQHVLTDDVPNQFLPPEPTPEQWREPSQLFVGKDYSNARVKDFFDLNKPFEDMYDRNFVPRMPWHDIHQMVVGQPARDLGRHFVQRWNYVLRQKAPSRLTPLLLPPPDFTQEDLERMQLTGTCEYQVLRSSGPWSLGLKKTEQSIQNAYLKLIEESEHLVYIENQFFVTSTVVDGIVIENKIGDALVQRIIRAHERGEAWKAYIIIPLLPGFEADVGTEKASSVRVICQCQFNSISRGPNSIFSRLESVGIRPDEYIHFFSLRKWGKFNETEDGKGGRITTEILYVHAKLLIVDDRIAIIGSANINERSMRGDRDSEVAVCVRDTSIVESRMAGKPWKAAKFAHSLRKRLMREHLGVDIEKLEVVERCMEYLEQAALRSLAEEEERREQERERERESERTPAESESASRSGGESRRDSIPEEPSRSEHSSVQDNESRSSDRTRPYPHHREHKRRGSQRERSERRPDKGRPSDAGAASIDSRKAAKEPKKERKEENPYPAWLYPDLHSFNWYAGTNVNRGIRDHKKLSYDSRVQQNPDHRLDIDGFGPDHFRQRMAQEEEVKKRQYQAAEPDFEIESTAQEILNRLLKDESVVGRMQFMRRFYDELAHQDTQRPVKKVSELPMPRTDESGSRAENNENIPIDPWTFDDPLDTQFVRDKWLAVAERNTLIFRIVFRCQPDDDVETWKDYKTYLQHYLTFCQKQKVEGGTDILQESGERDQEVAESAAVSAAMEEFKSQAGPSGTDSDPSALDAPPGSQSTPSRTAPGMLHKNRRLRRLNHFDQILDAQVAEDMLKGITGHLVMFPTEWLNREIDSGNWNFQLDRMAPLEIFD